MRKGLQDRGKTGHYMYIYDIMHNKKKEWAQRTARQKRKRTHTEEKEDTCIYHVMQYTHKIIYIVCIHTRVNSCVYIYYIH